MDVRDMKAMRESLDVFVAQFDDCVKMRPSRRHLRTYVAGQVGGLESKSVEPMALGAGTVVSGRAQCRVSKGACAPDMRRSTSNRTI